MTEAYFISDIHLRSSEERNGEVLLRFLRFLRQESGATHLFLVGDIFDLWIADHDFFIEKFKPIIDEIKALVDQGVQVHYFEGNHDLYLESYWRNRLGVSVHPDAAYFELAGKVVRVEHGDLVNPNDRGYLFLRWLLRTPFVRFLAKHLPGPVVNAIGERASSTSRQYTTDQREAAGADRIRQMVRLHAEHKFPEKPFDLIITGHTHVLDDHTFPASGRQIRSINLGSWFEPPQALKLTDTEVSFIAVPT